MRIMPLIFFLLSLDLAAALPAAKKAKLTSCNPSFCSVLESENIERSNLQPRIMAFGEATLEITDSKNPMKPVRVIKAGDGYYDLSDQMIVLRDLRDSKKRELIYDLKTNSLTYF